MSKDIHKVVDDVSVIMRELVETTESNVMYEIGLALNDGSDSENETDYLKKQNANKAKFKKKIAKIINESKKELGNVVKNVGHYTGAGTDKIEKKVQGGMVKLANKAIAEKDAKVKKIHRLERHIPLRKKIVSQTQEGIEKGIKVTYKNGRSIGFREYMEMNVRTTTQTEISDRQLDVGKRANIVFYVVNEFADCADDHAPYQGKVYYDEDYMTFNLIDEIKDAITSHIKANRLMSVAEVRDKPPYLTTRPNCRHTLTPLSIDQVINGQVEAVKKELKLSAKSYKPDNYDDMQQQRKNERQIRNYKARYETNKKLFENTGNEEYEKQFQKDRFLMRKWQKKQRELVKSNPVLERDYRKETKKILVNDLGVRYNEARDFPDPSKVTPPKSNLEWEEFSPVTKNSEMFEKISEWQIHVNNNYALGKNKETFSIFSKMSKLLPKLKTKKVSFSYAYDSDNTTMSLEEGGKKDGSINVIITHELSHAIDQSFLQKTYDVQRGHNISTIGIDEETAKPYKGIDKELDELIDSSIAFNKAILKYDDKGFDDIVKGKVKEILSPQLGSISKVKKKFNEEMEKALEEADNAEGNALSKELSKEWIRDDYKRKIDREVFRLGFDDMHRSQVNDMADALSVGKLFDEKSLAIGHGHDYYRLPRNRSMEIFAQYTALKIENPEYAEALLETYPDVLKHVDKMHKIVSKKVEGL